MFFRFAATLVLLASSAEGADDRPVLSGGRGAGKRVVLVTCPRSVVHLEI